MDIPYEYLLVGDTKTVDWLQQERKRKIILQKFGFHEPRVKFSETKEANDSRHGMVINIQHALWPLSAKFMFKSLFQAKAVLLFSALLTFCLCLGQRSCPPPVLMRCLSDRVRKYIIPI